MAGKPIQDSELEQALDTYCKAHGLQASKGEDQGKKRYLLSPGDVIVRLEEGRILCDSQAVFDGIRETIMDLREPEPTSAQNLPTKAKEHVKAPATPRKAQGGPMAKPDQGLADYHHKKSSLYKTEDGAAPSAAMVNRAANTQGFCTEIREFTVTDDLVRAHVRVTDPRTGQFKEDGVAFTRNAFIAKKTIDIISKHIKKVPNLVAGVDPVTMRPEISDEAQIYDLPAKLFIAKEVLKSWNFLGRFAVTTAERRCQDKLLNAEFREQEEIDLEQAEMADVAEAQG